MLLGKSQSIISFLPPETIPLIILFVSIITLTIIIERFIFFLRQSSLKTEDIRRIRNYLKSRQFDEAEKALSSVGKNPAIQALKAGIQAIQVGQAENLRQEIETEGYIQITRMERFLTGLGTIATITPLLGVLGTVTGMIRSFEEGVGTKNAEVGISEALVTTAMGLAVAIPAYVFYNYFVRKKEDRIIEIETLSEQALEILEPK
ncbi:MAG: MotA/TolQ/ExbB proton channel family protein [Leptospiraceae bacterium]|nr:MotA/TolQ/ExbB proton channel family protein [Leptospiraceae bacterium]